MYFYSFSFVLIANYCLARGLILRVNEAQKFKGVKGVGHSFSLHVHPYDSTFYCHIGV